MSYNQYMSDLQSLRRYVAMMAAEADLRSASGTGKPREAERGPHVTVQEAELEVRCPPLFRVVINNDDYTPMEFVVEVLQTIFGIDRNQAVRIMLYVHTRGKGVAGVFTYEIAETKAAQVNDYARQHQHPLLCTLEEA
jgi:ATP-dependent Clp protease adaptor protein ClpS